jgi:C1A family cysteine protease
MSPVEVGYTAAQAPPNGGTCTCSAPKGCKNPGYCQQCHDFGIGLSDTTFDWRYATSNPSGLACALPIQNQGQCGSCWAFAVAGVMEIAGYLKNHTQPLMKLSEQLIIDCNPDGYGCNGGWPRVVEDWLASATGPKQMLASDYPYITGQATCKIDSSKQVNA